MKKGKESLHFSNYMMDVNCIVSGWEQKQDIYDMNMQAFGMLRPDLEIDEWPHRNS